MSGGTPPSGPRKSATAARHQALYDRLVAAAEAAIARTGLSTLRARTLADAVGCSVGAIYGVFADLDALVLAVNDRTLAEMDQTLRESGPGTGPADHLLRLADAYLGFAVANPQRWGALFQHRMPPGRAIPAEYAARQVVAFSHIEAPLAALRPDLVEADRALLARTLFAAVHGMVALGLDEKVAAMPLPVLRAQIGQVVGAVARGL